MKVEGGRMRRVIADEWLSLDGVVQSPAYPDEDTSGGFTNGGWHTQYLEESSMNWVVDNVTSAGGYLLGRGTYEIFASYWPQAVEEEPVLAEAFNTRPKYVASRTLHEPLEWQNSRLLNGDVGAAVTELKEASGEDLHVIGSPQLVQSLLGQGVIDELRLMVDPILLGAGKRLFSDAGPLTRLRLVQSQVTPTGAMLTTYTRADRS
jgi:dihydrofolate reductase